MYASGREVNRYWYGHARRGRGRRGCEVREMVNARTGRDVVSPEERVVRESERGVTDGCGGRIHLRGQGGSERK